jgi:hypothetical protein
MNFERIELRRVAGLSRVGSVTRNLGLVALGVTAGMLAARSVSEPSPGACARAPGPVTAMSVVAEPSLAAPQVSCPAAEPAVPAPAPMHPVLSSPDGQHVIDHGFPAISPDGSEIAVVLRGSAEVSLNIITLHNGSMDDGVGIIVPEQPDQPFGDGKSPAQRTADQIAMANHRIAGFVTMPGAELGLTREEVLATPGHTTTLHVGELAVHHQGKRVTVRRTAAPHDVLLDWIVPELDPTGPCAPYAAAAYAVNQVLVLRFDPARCPAQGSGFHAFALDAAGEEPAPPAGPEELRADLDAGEIHGLPAMSPDGKTIALDAPLVGNMYPACTVNLMRVSDGEVIGSLRTSPESEDCGADKAPSPARRAMVAAAAARLVGWRPLPAVRVTAAGYDLWFRSGPRLWERGFSPRHHIVGKDGECSAPPKPVWFSAWHVGGDRVLISGGYASGGCMCDRQLQQIDVVPGFGAAAQDR